MLDASTLKMVIENTPLVSIDICLVCNAEILLGRRINEPLKGEWFTIGGRIHKNEAWQNALLRIVNAEVGLGGIPAEKFVLMGIWDHFYSNSAFDQNTSTHYVNLPHYVRFQSKPKITLDDQHSEFDWFDLAVVSNDEKIHRYVRNYAIWLMNNMDKSYA